jgi:hypothetical protein
MPQYEQVQYQQQEQQLPQEMQGQQVTPEYSQYQQVVQQEQPQQMPQVQYQPPQQVQYQYPTQQMPQIEQKRPIATVFKQGEGKPYTIPKQGLLPSNTYSDVVESTDMFSGKRYIKKLPQPERWSSGG